MAKLGLAIAGCSLLIAPSQGLTPPPLSLARRARQAAFPIARRAASLAGPEGLGDLQINAVDSVDWECKPKTAECVMVEKPRARDRLVVRFDDRWVDLTGWRAAHPAGPQWIDEFNGLDASEVMHAFHSPEALEMLARLPTARPEDVPANVPDPTPLTRDFRALRSQLEAEGWLKRSPAREAWHLTSWACVLAAGVKLAGAASHPGRRAAGVVLLAAANSYAGWLGHDYVHGTDKFCALMRPFAGLAAGLGVTMWSDKHNLHHAKTNEVGVDTDLPGGPVLFIWPPRPENDRPWRRVQHWYLPFAYSLLFVVWRIDSIKVSWSRRVWPELAAMGAHYAIALSLVRPATALAAVLLSGLISATIVTVSHQTENLLMDHEHDFVLGQLSTTTDAVTSNPVSEWLWGGMQYQLVHHLFPNVPRYKYPVLRPRVEALAAKHGLPYRSMGELPLLAKNLRLYRDVARAPADPGARRSKGGVTI